MNQTEVVDLKTGRQTFRMNSVDDKKTAWATGGLLDDFPIVCGGNDAKIHCITKDRTYRLNQEMLSKRSDAASVVINNDTALWVTGGLDQNYEIVKSTEFVTKEGKSSKGPDLPLALRAHAMVALDDGKFILIGGANCYNLESSSATFFYENKKGWRPGPPLKSGRRLHTAGLLTDRINSKQYIVVVEGMDANTSVEYLEYPGNNSWIKGPNYPCRQSGGTWHHAMVKYNGTDLVVIGGYNPPTRYSSNCYRLSCENGVFQWEKMEAQLSMPRGAFVAMTIPDHI